MSEIGMQNVFGEVQSPTIAGIVEALSRISESLDMKAEKSEKVQLLPVLGLNPSDPRRIYQAPDGERIWLSYPEPVIYLNGSQILSGEYQYNIDYIGGSVTFKGAYRPNSEDIISASFTHISNAVSHFGGCELKITFSAAFVGMTFTVSSSTGESYSDVVPASLIAYVNVKNPNTEYTISATDNAGKLHATSVTTGPYYGQYEASVNSFSATIVIKSAPGATITAKSDTQETYTKVAGNEGNAIIVVTSSGNYTVVSEYKNCKSESQVVEVLEDGGNYNATLNFITLLVTAETGATVQAKNALTTLTETSTGSVLFYLPNTGTWTVTATKDDKSSETTVNATDFQQYVADLSFEPSKLNDYTWKQISDLSSSGEAKDYFSIGDSKSILLSGQIPKGSASGYNTLNATVDVFIIGFDHNPSIEGSNKITFCMGKKNGKMVALATSSYNTYASTSYSNYQCSFCIFPTLIAAISWKESTMYLYVLSNGSSYSPQNPRQYSLMAALPSDLRSVLKSTRKYAKTRRSGKLTAEACDNYLFLFSEKELRTAIFTTGVDYSYQKRYEYFESGNNFNPSLMLPDGTVDTLGFGDGACPIWTRDSLFLNDNAEQGQNMSYLIIQGSKNYQITAQNTILPIMFGFCV